MKVVARKGEKRQSVNYQLIILLRGILHQTPQVDEEVVQVVDVLRMFGFRDDCASGYSKPASCTTLVIDGRGGRRGRS